MTTFNEFVTFGEGIEIKDSHYEFANGSKPKGTGNWMFSKHKNHDAKTHPKEDAFSHSGNYSAAKAAAKKHFGGQGHKGDIYTQT